MKKSLIPVAELVSRYPFLKNVGWEINVLNCFIRSGVMHSYEDTTKRCYYTTEDALFRMLNVRNDELARQGIDLSEWED